MGTMQESREDTLDHDYLMQLAAFASSLRLGDLPTEVVEHSKLILSDVVAAILSGSRAEEVQTLARRLAGDSSRGISTVIGTRSRTDARVAALINGISGTWEELDEGNAGSKGHPGIHVIPAALAQGEALGRSGQAVLEAIAAGYEVAARVGGATTLRDRFHGHGTWGTVGAAVAAAKLLSFGPSRTRETVNVAAALTLAPPGRTAIEGATVRNAYAGLANSTGILATALVESGITGQRDGLADVFGTVSGTAFDVNAATHELGREYQLVRNYFKLYPCCRHTHAAIEAALQIQRDNDLVLDDIESIQVDTYDRAAWMCGSPHAENPLAARFSIPYIVAQTLKQAQITVETFEPEALASRTVQELARKTIVRERADCTAQRPLVRVAEVTIDVGGGRILRHQAKIDEGKPREQVSPAQLRQKFFALVEPCIGTERAERVLSTIGRLEEVETINELTDLLLLD
jgi:2-methylcitrate dehydratase PrpD